MVQAIQKFGGLRKLNRQNLLEFVLRSGTNDIFAIEPSPGNWASLLSGGNNTSTVSSNFLLLFNRSHIPYSSVFNNLLLVLSSIMLARFLLGLREMNEDHREPEYREQTLTSDQLSANNTNRTRNTSNNEP
ncbi:hypothetical protein GYMLUDRAFT_55523 [Collybiopsis luxurians FD-317 M1]|nr:hypothetical protein GYMLUDRAFT_55523 [Collybiopsis luxurians FD-317 M1]